MTRRFRRFIELGFIFWLWVTAQAAAADIKAGFVFDLQAGFNNPSAVRVSEEGKAYVLDGVNGRVVMFSAEGELIGEFSAPRESPFNLPMDLRLYRDRIIVADSGNHRLVMFTNTGVYLRAIPLPGADQKAEPTGLAVIDEVVYWSDRANSRICATDISRDNHLWCWGGFGSGEGEFRYPFMLTTDRDNYLYAVDVLNGRVQVFNERGRSFGALSRFGVTDQSLLRPNGISLDEHEILMVSDTYTGRILLFRGRSFVGLLQDEQGKAMRFDQPVGITRWRDRLYVVEMARHRVRVISVDEDSLKVRPGAPAAYYSQPTRRDCVTCHLSWSEAYRGLEEGSDPMPPVGSKRMCLSCHHGAVIDSRPSLGQGEQHPDYDHPSKERFFKPGGDRQDSFPDGYPLVDGHIPYCGTCHTPHRFGEQETGLSHHRENLWMRDSNQESEFCRHCHESLFAEGTEMARKMGMHPVAVDLDEPVEIEGHKLERVDCQSCHRVHGGEKGSASLVVSSDEIGRLCATCHPRHHAESLDEARQKGIHPVNVALDQSITIGDRELTRLDCLSCHSVHAGKRQTPSLVEEHRRGQLCKTCHEHALAVIDTDHDLRVTASESRNLLDETPEEAGVCGSCHSMHRNPVGSPGLSIGDQLPEGVESSHLSRDRLCLSCHREEGIGWERVITDYTHPYRDLVMHSDPAFMPLLDKDELIVATGQIACITCHDPHVWTPMQADESRDTDSLDSRQDDQDGTVLNSFLRQRQTQDGFCVVCHGLETRVKYKYFHDQRSRPHKAEYLR